MTITIKFTDQEVPTVKLYPNDEYVFKVNKKLHDELLKILIQKIGVENGK